MTFLFIILNLSFITIINSLNNSTDENILKRPFKNKCTLKEAAADKDGCTTSVVKGLTLQIVEEMNSMGFSFSSLNNEWIHCDDPCVNQLQSTAANSLADAAKSKDDYITLNSAYRSCAQQYLLYTWYLNNGQCNIGLAAKPGTSNHEGGRAIDTSNYDYWLTTLEKYDWTHSYPDSDPVHFDYYAADDLALENLRAFQRLWNRNSNSNLVLTEDGLYGPATEEALGEAPCDGW